MSDLRLISPILEIIDRLNVPDPIASGSTDLYKEWQHFCVIDAEERIHAIINFNLSGDIRTIGGNGICRLILIVFEKDRSWNGDVVTFDPSDVRVLENGLHLIFGENSLHFKDGRYQINVSLAKPAMHFELELAPTAVPLLIRNNTPIGSGYLNWLLVPRLEVSGYVTIDKRHYYLHNAVGYHDHNWGRWHWGDNFSWEWGVFLPEAAPDGEHYTVVFDRTSNKARTSMKELTLVLWRNSDLHKIFTRRNISTNSSGYFRPVRNSKLPRIMNLINTQTTHEIPEHFQIGARDAENWLDASFTSDDIVQIAVPNESDFENTIISEVLGRFELRGNVKYSRLNLSGPAFFEFLSQ